MTFKQAAEQVLFGALRKASDSLGNLTTTINPRSSAAPPDLAGAGAAGYALGMGPRMLGQGLKTMAAPIQSLLSRPAAPTAPAMPNLAKPAWPPFDKNGEPIPVDLPSSPTPSEAVLKAYPSMPRTPSGFNSMGNR